MTRSSTRSLRARATLSCTLAVAQIAAVAGPALAATSDIGKNIGDEVTTWAKAILLGLVALVAIPILAKRDVVGGLTLALLAVIVGGFAFAPDTVKGVIGAIWTSIAG